MLIDLLLLTMGHVLVFVQVASLRSARTSTRPHADTAVGKVRTEAALPAKPLGQSPAFTVALPFPFGFVGQLQRRICSITSLLTCPT